MTASAERELWLDANELTFQKYWDTVCSSFTLSLIQF